MIRINENEWKLQREPQITIIIQKSSSGLKNNCSVFCVRMQ